MFWKKTDHSPVIEKIVLQLISDGHQTGALPFLSMRDAARYAQDKSPIIEENFIQCHASIGDGYYAVEFKPHPNKGVYMSAWKFDD